MYTQLIKEEKLPKIEDVSMYFFCHDCKYEDTIGQYEDPTTSTGSCPGCGSKNWNIYKERYGCQTYGNKLV